MRCTIVHGNKPAVCMALLAGCNRKDDMTGFTIIMFAYVHLCSLFTQCHNYAWHNYHCCTCSFEPFSQKCCLNSLRVQDMNWPPQRPSNNQSLSAKKKSSFTFKLSCGDTEGRFEFGLYRFTEPSAQALPLSSQEGGAMARAQEGNGAGEEYTQRGILHHAVDMQVPWRIFHAVFFIVPRCM